MIFKRILIFAHVRVVQRFYIRLSRTCCSTIRNRKAESVTNDRLHGVTSFFKSTITTNSVSSTSRSRPIHRVSASTYDRHVGKHAYTRLLSPRGPIEIKEDERYYVLYNWQKEKCSERDEAT